MGVTGLEPLPFSKQNAPVSESGGNKSGNKSAPNGDPPGGPSPSDPRLAGVVGAWPKLLEVVRAAIAAMVEAAQSDTPAHGETEGDA